MRIVILTQYYPPEIGAPQNRLSDLAGRLARLGHRVTVLTAMPNYPAGEIAAGYRRRLYAREVVEGVEIHRGWLFATRSRRVVPRLLNYFSFVFSSLAAGAFVLARADFIVVESPPLFLGISGYLLSRMKRARLVLNVADLWPKAAVDLKVVTNPFLIRLAERLEELLYRKASLVTSQTQGMVDDIRGRMPEKDVRLLTNGADLERFDPRRFPAEPLEEFGLAGRFVVVYAGIHGPAQALAKVMEAAAHLRSYPEIVFAFFGEGPLKAELQERARAKGLENVKFYPPQPRERMPEILAGCAAGVVPLYDSELMRAALPSKMFEVMAAAVPVLLSAPEGEASAIVRAAEGGVCVSPESPELLAAAVEELYLDRERRLRLGRNARAYVERHYSRQAIAERFMEYLLHAEGSGAAPAEPIAA